jgi:hypothetical protein
MPEGWICSVRTWPEINMLDHNRLCWTWREYAIIQTHCEGCTRYALNYDFESLERMDSSIFCHMTWLTHQSINSKTGWASKCLTQLRIASVPWNGRTPSRTVHHGQASGVKTLLEKRGNKFKEESRRKECLGVGWIITAWSLEKSW